MVQLRSSSKKSDSNSTTNTNSRSNIPISNINLESFSPTSQSPAPPYSPITPTQPISPINSPKYPLFTGGYLTESGLNNLKHYRYQSGFSSLLDRYLLLRFWTYCVEFCPLWIAPNLITFISLLHALATYFIFYYYSPTLNESCPNIVYSISAILMFIYQTLDGIDGKQARRTSSSSPLGQLFDHGCDSICCFLSGIFMCSVLQFGSSSFSYICLLLHIIPFFFSNWEESVTGIMRFGLIAVSEGQCFQMGLLLLTGIYGAQIWLIPITIPAINLFNGLLVINSIQTELRYLCMIIGFTGVFYQALTSIYYVIQYYQSIPTDPTILINGHIRTRPIAAIWPLFQYLLFLLLSTIWIYSTISSTIFMSQTRIILLIIGILFAYQLCRLIINRVTGNQNSPEFYWIFRPFPLIIIYSIYSNNLLIQSYINLAYLIYVLIFYIHFILITIRQICNYLNISVFTIKSIEKQK